MTKNKKVTHYASSTHGQPNANHPNARFRNDWNKEANASASNVEKAPKGVAESEFGKGINNILKVKKSEYDHFTTPWNFTGLQFKFEIPDCAYITNIRFEVPIKVDGNITVESPHARFNLYNGAKSVKDNIKNNNGWNDGTFYQSSNYKNLSNAWKTHIYEMSGAEFRKRGYPISELNGTRFGIDLIWKYPTKMSALPTTNKVSIKYVKCIISYEMADESITFDRVTTGDTPRRTNCGEWYSIDITYQNKSNASCCGNTAKNLKITFPPNTQIVYAGENYNPQTKTWTVQCKPNAWKSISFSIRDYGVGLDKINVQDSTTKKNWNYWVYSTPKSTDVGEITGYAGTMQKNVSSCITFESKVNASDGLVDYHVSLGNIYDEYGEQELSGNLATDVVWTLDAEKSSEGVSLDHQHCSDTLVKVNVPRGEVVNVVFRGCFVPDFTGTAYASARIDQYPEEYACHVYYKVIEPPVYVVRNKPQLDSLDRTTEEITLYPSIINFRTHRVASSTEIGAYVIDCGIADLDGTMADDDCTLSANVWEKIDYIGCVPLEYHHYDPDSTYSNKGISESYKNKTYKGKEGVIDEDISLKFKVRPKQTPTLQGLVELDKPTPINANWRCFEGDPLNHRGWAVFSELKVKRTNPLWYDCEAKVDYITHDINTKFQIFKELRVNTAKMPSIMAETFELGENLSTALDIFNIDTDGGFLYDEEGQDGAKNLFSLDEGQHLSIATRNPLSDVSQIRFDWYSTKILENRENTVERIFRIKDDKGNAVLEYEYANFQFYEDYVTCDIIVRVKTEGESWDTQIYPDIDLRTEIEVDPIADDGEENDDEEIIEVVEDTTYYYYDEGNDEYIEIIDFEDYEGDIYIYDESTDTYVLVEDDDDDEQAYEEGYIAPSFDPGKYLINTIYGTSTEYIINGNILTIYEAGYNGREIAINNIELLKSTGYYFDCEWVNKNQDGTTEDVLSYIDINLTETILDTEYAKFYNNLFVSPFPIPYKTVVYTRESEEGTIFYLTGSEPFKYRIEPYYQFHCGCDMVTREGVSLFNLNNSYTYFYIENGLVRFGFNKFNGRLYLAKWDIVSKDWVTTHYFHMSDDIKFSLESYSDDKIVIKAGNNTYFTIWRGHPFIGIKNPTDEIFIDSNFNYCLSDKINGVVEPYPKIFSFLNQNNLLPVCVGGTKLDYDCLAIDDDIITPGVAHTLEINQPQTTPKAGEECIIDVTLDPLTNDGSVHYLIDNKDVATVEYPFDLTHTFNDQGSYKVQAVYVGDEDDDIAISESIVVKVDAPSPRPGSAVDENPQDQIAGQYHLSMTAPDKFTYLDGKQVVLKLTKGSTPIKGYPIEVPTVSGAVSTRLTDKQGKVYITNKAVPVGKYQWGGRFYDSTDEDQNRKLLLSKLKFINVVKAKPKITYNAKDGRLNKGKYLHVKLHGVNSPLRKQSITYTLNGGSKTTKKTNDKGKIYIKFNKADTYKIKIMYAGNKNYEPIEEKFTLKVVK